MVTCGWPDAAYVISGTKVAATFKPGAGLLDVLDSPQPPARSCYVITSGTSDISRGNCQIIFVEWLISVIDSTIPLQTSLTLQSSHQPADHPHLLLHRKSAGDMGKEFFSGQGMHLSLRGKLSLANMLLQALVHADGMPIIERLQKSDIEVSVSVKTVAEPYSTPSENLNIDVLDYTNPLTQRLRDILSTCSVNTLTRLTASSSTAIDNVISKIPNISVSVLGRYNVVLTQHRPVCNIPSTVIVGTNFNPNATKTLIMTKCINMRYNVVLTQHRPVCNIPSTVIVGTNFNPNATKTLIMTKCINMRYNVVLTQHRPVCNIPSTVIVGTNFNPNATKTLIMTKCINMRYNVVLTQHRPVCNIPSTVIVGSNFNPNATKTLIMTKCINMRYNVVLTQHRPVCNIPSTVIVGTNFNPNATKTLIMTKCINMRYNVVLTQHRPVCNIPSTVIVGTNFNPNATKTLIMTKCINMRYNVVLTQHRPVCNIPSTVIVGSNFNPNATKTLIMTKCSILGLVGRKFYSRPVVGHTVYTE
ncbi:hypothetical protein J6590_065078 [Homalodisca vitripennis]|nr:hypothetical protein J6590_065078 [Homalodisca vitripennis]